MATFCFLITLIVALLVSPSLSLSSTSQLKLHTPTISSAPAILSDPPLSPHTEFSPEIAPLLPSPGSTISTIPSNPSPPNPDEVSSVGPDSAFAPSGSLSASSAMNPSLSQTLKLLNVSFLFFWLVLVLPSL